MRNQHESSAFKKYKIMLYLYNECTKVPSLKKHSISFWAFEKTAIELSVIVFNCSRLGTNPLRAARFTISFLLQLASRVLPVCKIEVPCGINPYIVYMEGRFIQHCIYLLTMGGRNCRTLGTANSYTSFN